jgi:hypothetical protein
MSTPRRVQLSRKKGWRMPPNTVSVARPGRWGNPYPVIDYGLALSLRLFKETARGLWSPRNAELTLAVPATTTYQRHCDWLTRHGRHPIEAARTELRGKNLACWCPLDQPCHADVLLEIANIP